MEEKDSRHGMCRYGDRFVAVRRAEREDHKAWMARAYRQRRVLGVIWWCAAVVTIVAAMIATAELVTHPETIGEFFGRIAKGFAGGRG